MWRAAPPHAAVLESSTADPSQHKLLQNQGLRAIQRSAPIKLLMRLALQAWLLSLDSNQEPSG